MRMIASSTSLSVLGQAQIRESPALGSIDLGLTWTALRHVLTGSYHNYFRIFDVDSLSDVVLQADKSAFKAKKIGGALPGNKLGAKNGTRGLRDAMQMETLDFNKKILHASWHPRENTIAVRFALSFWCGWTVGIHLYSLDRCNEQPVLVQRGMMFVLTLTKSIVQLCHRRRHLLPTPLSSCRRLFLLPFTNTFSVTLIYFSDVEHAHFTSPLLPTTRPLPLVPASFTLIIRRTCTTSGPSPSPIFGSGSASLTRSPSSVIHALPHPQCRVFPLTRQEVRKKKNYNKNLHFLGNLSEIAKSGICWNCRDGPTRPGRCCDRGSFVDRRSVDFFPLPFVASSLSVPSSMHPFPVRRMASTSSLLRFYHRRISVQLLRS